ncbi:MAG: ATP-dependent sacrificial sulfur transferase LarE [Candidatus Krumholzibacteria bacterium]|nr:ATP-dependent sacrificial sulfur transferase LarE [Candidatus Krumholzibacteria bacterium]
MSDLQGKLSRLLEIVERCGSAAVAFSGGVDSTLLLSVASEVLEGRVLAVTVAAPFMPRHELHAAAEAAALIGARHITVDVDLDDIERFCANPVDRCYFCKRHLFSKILEIARREGLSCVMEASNADDSGDYRPGMRAVRELGILSPLLDAGLVKEEIRELLRGRGVPGWDRPSTACLASRVPYGEPITIEKLLRIDRAEDLLRSLGFAQCRVRHHGGLARIEVEPDMVARTLEPEMRETILKRLEGLGFAYVAVDLRGFRTGSLNEGISRSEA